jgi:hypothetical protein
MLRRVRRKSATTGHSPRALLCTGGVPENRFGDGRALGIRRLGQYLQGTERLQLEDAVDNIV